MKTKFMVPLVIVMLTTLMMQNALSLMRSEVTIESAGYVKISDDKPLRLVAYSGADTIEQMTADLKLAKDIGFDGVKLWNTASLLSDGNLAEILDIGRGLGLKFNLPLMVGNYKDFPDDVASIATFKTYLSGLTEVVKGRNNILWYGLWYPTTGSRGDSWNQLNVARPEYRQALQDFINVLKAGDPNHEVRLFEDYDPTILQYPKNFSHVDGFGVQPYTQVKDSIEKERIQSSISYFLDTGKIVYIDEWGLYIGTNPDYGLCTNEETKARMLTEFVSFVEGEGLTWTYYKLLDSKAFDWGIVNENRSLRPSGQILQTLLRGT